MKLFKEKNPIIGSLHFSPLLGYEGFENINKILDCALLDLKSFEEGGVNGIILENNYDLPHKIKVGPETVASMTYLANEIIKKTRLPVGISVLWNDYESALSIAKICNAKFVRVPVFVDSVKTSFGKIIANPKKVIDFRKKIGAEDILLFTDIHVKHAKMLKEKSIEQSVNEAIKKGSDGIIITGKWTGNAPNLDDLRKARLAAGNFPILIGSGASKENIKSLLKYANSAIVSTSLKEGENVENERNVKPFSRRVSLKKVRDFICEVFQ
jgi:hypothetical protein